MRYLVGFLLAVLLTGCASIQGGNVTMERKLQDKSTFSIDVTPDVYNVPRGGTITEVK